MCFNCTAHLTPYPFLLYQVPVLVIAGSADRLLPSSEEAERLKNLIPGCRSMVLEGHGHAPLFGGRVDISEIIAEDPALDGVFFPEVEGAVEGSTVCM